MVHSAESQNTETDKRLMRQPVDGVWILLLLASLVHLISILMQWRIQRVYNRMKFMNIIFSYGKKYKIHINRNHRSVV